VAVAEAVAGAEAETEVVAEWAHLVGCGLSGFRRHEWLLKLHCTMCLVSVFILIANRMAINMI